MAPTKVTRRASLNQHTSRLGSCYKSMFTNSSLVSQLCTVVSILLLINQQHLTLATTRKSPAPPESTRNYQDQASRIRRQLQAASSLSSTNSSSLFNSNDAKFPQNEFHLQSLIENSNPTSQYANYEQQTATTSRGDQPAAASRSTPPLLSPLTSPLVDENDNFKINISQQQQQQHAPTSVAPPNLDHHHQQQPISCPPNGLLTFEIATGFIYKPTQQRETLSMMPSTLQLTDCLDYCLHNQSCLAINFEMGLCVLLAASAAKNPQNLFSSQFPVFTIYAEKKCLLANVSTGHPTKQQFSQARRFRCQRAWTFERVAGFEMKLKPRRQLQVASRELCMDACLLERDFECRSANWFRKTGVCTLSDQDRHSVSQSEAGDQRIKSALLDYYGPSNATAGAFGSTSAGASKLHYNQPHQHYSFGAQQQHHISHTGQLLAYEKSRLNQQHHRGGSLDQAKQKLFDNDPQAMALQTNYNNNFNQAPVGDAPVDYLENNCIYEPNKLCEFRKIQNRVLKTVDSIYQDVASLDECKQKCLTAPYRCYSFDYGDTSERVCRTSHLDQASLLSVREPYLDVVGAITYELASCFNVTIQCRAKEMVASVSASKSFKGKIYAKTRPTSCLNDVHDSLQFNLTMKYNDDSCAVHSSSNEQQGVFSQDIVIQHHDRIVTTQDVGLSVYCQYDLGNRSVTNQVDLAIERIPDSFESKQTSQQQAGGMSPSASSSSLTITGLATTVVKSPNVTMRITNMNGQPVTNATVGDRLALLFEIKEKTSPFGIFVRNIVAMDGKQLMALQQETTAISNQSAPPSGVYHYASSQQQQQPQQLNEGAIDSMIQQNSVNSIQFIDPDGCPTDANLMGPLVKMDPSGHRLLAPFDAFKFPTSDMVFFRAVVTSCLAECGPAVCGSSSSMMNSNNIADSGADALLPSYDSYSTQSNGGDLTTSGSSTSTTMSAARHPTHSSSPDRTTFLTTRTMAMTTTSPPKTPHSEHATSSTPTTPEIADNRQQIKPLTASSTILQQDSYHSRPGQLANDERLASTGADEANNYAKTTLSTTDFDSLDRPVTTVASGGGDGGSSNSNQPHSTTNLADDSMTIVPGFASSKSLDQQTEMQTSTIPPTTRTSWSTTGATAAAELQQLMINMTNNHNGPTPPRPTVAAISTTSGQLAQQQQQQTGQPAQGAAVSLIEMSKEQKRELVKLFETKLKQQQFAQPTVTNANLSDLSDLYTGFLSSLMLNEVGQQAASGSSPLSSNELISLANNINYKKQLDQNGNGNQQQQPAQLASSASSANLLADQLAATNNPVDLIRALEFVYENNKNAQLRQDVANYANELQNLIDKQLKHDDDQRATRSQQRQSSTILDRTQQQTPMAQSIDRLNNNKIAQSTTTITQQQQQQSQNEHKMQKKRDMANRQALADSYLGAFQSFGRRKRRRRRKRQSELGDGESGSLSSARLLTPGHIYMEQPQFGSTDSSAVAPSLKSNSQSSCDNHIVFKRAIVEMYHTYSFDHQRHARIKRHATPSVQQDNDLEELVVQSIKIVDRLHFEDEQQQRQKATPSADVGHRHSIKKASPSTRSNGILTKPVTSAIRNIDGRSRTDLDIDGGDQDSRDAHHGTFGSSFGLSALSVFLVSLCFIFVQLSMVLIYLVGWTRRKSGSRSRGTTNGWPITRITSSSRN